MDLKIKQDKYIRNKNYHRIINRKIQAYINNPVGSLYLWGLPINKLPNNLKYIDGDLNISYTKISELPKGLVVNGSLDIDGIGISELPDDIVINGDLYCFFTPLIEKYSKEEIRKKYNIKGEIYGIQYKKK